MTDTVDLSELSLAIAELEEKKAIELVDRSILEERPALQIVDELAAGMTEVGRLFSTGEYFLSELVFSSTIFKNGMNKLSPLLEKMGNRESSGTVIMGTVAGDIHDLGKNIVITMLECAGFKVLDLGVDVPAVKFVHALQESGASLVGLSALLTTAFDPMQNTVEVIEKAGLRESAKIMIGGGPASEELRKIVQADYYGKNALSAVEIAKKIYS